MILLPEISSDLKPYVKKILEGDILNMPLLHKQEMERITSYCIAYQNQQTAKLRAELYELKTDFQRFKTRLENIPFGKKRK